jgi:hypothetical protein
LRHVGALTEDFTVKEQAMTEAIRIRAILFRDGELWVGQCLEYDIGAQASDLDQLHSRLLIAIDCERKESVARNGAPFAGIDRAPQHFFDMWEKAPGGYSPRRPSKLPNDGSLDLNLALCA